MILRPTALAIAALLIAAGAAAQPRPDAGADPAADSAPQVADVPAGPAALRGQVLHQDPARAAGVEILLYALPAGGAPGVRHAVSDAQGGFAFEGISNDPDTAYLVGARHSGVPFPGTRVVFAPDETLREVSVRIGEATADPADVEVAEVDLRLSGHGGRLQIAEQHQLENRGAQTVYVPRETRERARPAFDARLPAGATDFEMPLGIAPEGLVADGERVRFFGPVYPSEWPEPVAQDQRISFEYAVPAAGPATEIRKPFPRGARRVVVRAPESGPALRIAGAREEAAEEIEGRTFRRWVVDGVRPGGELALSVDLPPARTDRGAVTLAETRIFLELDDAVLLVREEHKLDVEGDTPVVAPPGETLLAIPIPAQATDLRFDRGAFELGLAAGPDGGAQLDGPLPPGESVVEIAYHLPADPAAGAVLERRFGAALPLLSIYVADTGLRLDSDRLHRRRPVATSDRTYLHREAFEVAPDETVRLALTPARATTGLPRAALYAAVALAAALAAAFLVAPLRGAGPAEAASEDEGEDAAQHERNALLDALRDLEHDHETGKISEPDYVAMRAELRARVAALLRAAPRSTPAPAPAPIACPACGAAARPSDRFCANCGAKRLARAEHEASA